MGVWILIPIFEFANRDEVNVRSVAKISFFIKILFKFEKSYI